VTSQSKRIEVQLKGTAGNAVRKFQLRFFQAVTSATPVDTGFARAGWTPTVGSPIADRLERPKERSAAETAAVARLAENGSRASAISGTYKLEQGKVFISNAVPYIVFLNDGSSSQAPKKFVERAIEAALLSLGRV
jgi:hypothetical protein